MPGWVWVLVLSSLAASYPTFFLIVACIVACIVWPEFRFAAGVAVLFALVQIIIEGKEQKARLQATTPLDIDTAKTAPLLVQKALEALVLLRAGGYPKITPALIESLAENATAWSPRALRRETSHPDVFKGIASEYNAKISLDGARQAVLELFGRRAELKSLSRHANVFHEQAGGRTTVWLLGRTPDLADPPSFMLPALKATYGGIIEKTPQHVALKGSVPHPWLKDRKPALLTLSATPDKDSPFGWAITSIRLEADFWPPRPSASEADMTPEKALRLLEQALQTAVETGLANYRTLDGNVLDQAAMHSPAWSSYALRREEHAAFIFEGVPATFDAKISAEDARRAVRERLGRQPPLTCPEKLGPVQVEGEGPQRKIWILGKTASPRTVRCQIELLRLEPEDKTVFLEGRLAGRAQQAADSGLIRISVSRDSDSPFGYVFDSLWIRMPEGFVETEATSAMPQPASAPACPMPASQQASAGASPEQTAPASLSADKIVAKLVALFTAKISQMPQDASGRDAQADASAFAARIPRRFIDRAACGKATQEEYGRLVDAILAEMGATPAKAASEAEARTGRETHPLRTPQARTSQKPKPPKATKGAKEGRMPLRRPRSEDDVCDILFDIFEAKTAKPLKDASGQIVGKDCGGDAVAFIDRVPQEFIDHALRWETPLEEYEAFVERIIAEMYPKDIGEAKPARHLAPLGEEPPAWEEASPASAPVKEWQSRHASPAPAKAKRRSPEAGAPHLLGGLPRKLIQRLLDQALNAALATGFTHFDSLTDDMLDQTALGSPSWSSLAERRSALFPVRFAGVPDEYDARISVEDARRAACDCFGRAAPLHDLPEDSRVMRTQNGTGTCCRTCAIWLLGQWRGWGDHGLRVRTRTVEALGKMTAMAGEVLDGKGQKLGELRALVRPDAASPFGFVIESLHLDQPASQPASTLS